MTSRNVAIEVKNVSIHFKSRLGFLKKASHTALNKVSFSLYQGETLGVIGRNGCGKSTLLKVLSGIYTPDSGQVIRNTKKISLQTLNTGFDPQLSGRDNALLSSMFLGLTWDEAYGYLEKIKAFSELGVAFDEPVKTYSSGMFARLGFSIGTLINADVLLIDESLGVGDAGFRKKAEKIILDKMNSDQTVVFVSHAGAQVKRLCQRVVWLENCEVMEVGESQYVVDKYERYIQNTK